MLCERLVTEIGLLATCFIGWGKGKILERKRAGKQGKYWKRKKAEMTILGSKWKKPRLNKLVKTFTSDK